MSRFGWAAMVDPARAYALSAQLRHGEGRRLRPGDLATLARRPWRPGESGRIELRLQPIG